MTTLLDFNPLKSLAVPNVGRIEPRGLIVIVGPNSSGKTQMLKDIQQCLFGMPRKLVVCDAIELDKPPDLDVFLNVLAEEGLTRITRTGPFAIPCRYPDAFPGGANAKQLDT